jgi:phosphoribosylaminoimidazolecarboxamide formyltransferase / IMP cyclohydrolase
VRELRLALGLPSAASFKHVSPAGAAIGLPLDDALRDAYQAGKRELSPLANAYARARGADRVSSYGDWVALSDVVDESTARLLQLEASDGVIAPGYEPAALDLLRAKRGGRYPVLEIDAGYDPPATEVRDIFGVRFEQPRNAARFDPSRLGEEQIVTRRTELPAAARRDMVVALLALKYTQSNSVCLAADGQVLGLGAGQQSRIGCTRLAASKADTWFLRQHPRVRELPFQPGLSRTGRDNAVDQFLRDDLTPPEEELFAASFTSPPRRLSADDRADWLARLSDVTLGSDAFIPFRDNVDRASRSGVRYVVQPGGSARDADVVHACDEYGMTMVLTGVRLFTH